MNRNLLLISNSTNPGEEYLGWPRPYIKSFLNQFKVKTVLFIPYAGVTLSYDDYEARVKAVFSGFDVSLKSVHNEAEPIRAIIEAEAIAVGGGNTFHLVHMLHKMSLMQAIRERALLGVPYIGWSAGANVACPALKTSNDMPIIDPIGFDCLNLVPFQINPHYLDAHPEGHGGETREQRILEFLALHPGTSVAGLRETSLLEVKGNSITLKGKRNMRLFRPGEEPAEFEPGADINCLLEK